MDLLWTLLVLSLPLTDYSINPELLKSGGQISLLVALLLWLGYGWRLLVGSDTRIPLDRPTKYFLLFFLLCLLTVINSAQLAGQEYRGETPWLKSLKQTLQLAISGSIYLFVPYFVRNRNALERTLKAWGGAYLIVLGFGVLELLSWWVGSGKLTSFLWSFHAPATPLSLENYRLRLLAPEPSMAVNYLLAVLPFLMLGAIPSFSRRQSWLLAMSALILVALTFSLSGFIALLVLFSLALPGFRGHLYRATAYVAVILVLGLAVPTTRTMLEDVYERVRFVSEDESVRARLADFQGGLTTFASNPVLGVGLGNSIFFFEQDYPDWALADAYVHLLLEGSAEGEFDLAITNLPVRILAETGLLGAFLFLLWHVRVFQTSLSCVRVAKTENDKALSLALFVSIGTLVFHYIATPGFNFRYLFFLFGLVSAWHRILTSEQQRLPQVEPLPG